MILFTFISIDLIENNIVSACRIILCPNSGISHIGWSILMALGIEDSLFRPDSYHRKRYMGKLSLTIRRSHGGKHETAKISSKGHQGLLWSMWSQLVMSPSLNPSLYPTDDNSRASGQPLPLLWIAENSTLFIQIYAGVEWSKYRLAMTYL